MGQIGVKCLPPVVALFADILVRMAVCVSLGMADWDDVPHGYQKNEKTGREAGHKRKNDRDHPAENPEKTQKNPDGSISTTTSMSTTTSTTTSMSTSIDTGSAPAQDAGICEKTQPWRIWIDQLTDARYEKLQHSRWKDDMTVVCAFLLTFLPRQESKAPGRVPSISDQSMYLQNRNLAIKRITPAPLGLSH